MADSTPKPRRNVRVVKVVKNERITPNMVRLTLTAPGLADVPQGCEGANCKIMLPDDGVSEAAFEAQLASGPRPTTRTYTVRHARPEKQEVDVDFVVHDAPGPAANFALTAEVGDFCGFAGPSANKIEDFYADWYLVAADMSALPVASATLEAMPRDATGIAIFEVLSEDDKQVIDAPAGIEQHWFVHADPHTRSGEQERIIRSLTWPDGVIQTCIAGESGVIKALREFLHVEKQIPRTDTYISGYWKIGLKEDEHQAMKRAEATATT
ncbi:MAG: siderophore-interacting protein [Pseudomonadota bacterium]